jgi:hypothetical protein
MAKPKKQNRPCGVTLRRNWKALFHHFPDVGRDDVAQEAALAVSRARGYDPERGAASTFVYLVASRAAFDLARKRGRQARGDVGMVRPDATDHHPAADAEDLVDWVAGVRQLALRQYGTKLVRCGRKFYRIADVAAVVLLAGRLKLGGEGVRCVLGRRPDLLAAAGFRHVPGRRLFTDAEGLLRRARVGR